MDPSTSMRFTIKKVNGPWVLERAQNFAEVIEIA
jgi:hypothetical protein